MTQVSYRFRCYPNKTQQAQLQRYFGSKRFVWNLCLAWRSNLYEALGESVTGVDLSRELTWLKRLEGYDWLREVPSTVLTQALRDQDRAFRNFFAGRASYPQFKARYHDQSIRFQIDQRRVTSYYRAGELLKLPGLGKLKVRWSRKPTGVPKMVTLSRDRAGRYFITLSVEEAIEPKPAAGQAVGIDRGVKAALVLSDGTAIANPRHLAQRQEQLARLQKRLARQKKGSNRRRHTVRRIARLHARIADTRRDWLHKTTSRLVDENQVIVLEDLNVAGMTASAKGDREQPGKQVRQKAGLNRAILDVAFSELARQIEYKAEWYGRTVLKVDRFYPSSKTCSACGHRLDELRLDVREWTCPKCGIEHDRDINAARNILREGLKRLTPGGTGEVRASGGEGACPVAVSARIVELSNPCPEQGR